MKAVKAVPRAMKMVLLLGLLSMVVLVFFVGFSFVVPPRTETNLASYERLLEQWNTTGLTEHFPAQIPDNAQNFRLSHFPGHWQGGAWLQIRMRLPPEDIAEILTTTQRHALKQFWGGTSIEHINAADFATTNFFTNDTNDKVFPPDYKIFVYKSVNNGNWNHGSSCGVVVSEKRSEVVYWAERW